MRDSALSLLVLQAKFSQEAKYSQENVQLPLGDASCALDALVFGNDTYT